jgi:hypothetical protein
MKTKQLFNTGILLLFALFFNSCHIFSYLTPPTESGFHNDIVFQTFQWDNQATEADIQRDFTDFIREALRQSRFQDYILLFQSNFNLGVGERTFLIKLFRTSEEKDAYMIRSRDVAQRTQALSSPEFINRIQQLPRGMPAEQVFEMVPELAFFRADLQLYQNHTLLQLANYRFYFDLRGFLLNISDGTTPPPVQRPRYDWTF